VNTNQMPDSYSWKHEAGLADLHRDRIVEIAEKMIHEFDKDSGSGHRREELEWALQLFRSAYDDITSIHIRPFRDTQHSRANHLQHLLVPLMVGAFQLGGRSAIDNPAVADTIQFASHARGNGDIREVEAQTQRIVATAKVSEWSISAASRTVSSARAIAGSGCPRSRKGAPLASARSMNNCAAENA